MISPLISSLLDDDDDDGDDGDDGDEASFPIHHPVAYSCTQWPTRA